MHLKIIIRYFHYLNIVINLHLAAIFQVLTIH